MPRAILVAALLLLTFQPPNLGVDAKGASVSLAAKWQATPFLLEAAEFLVSCLNCQIAGILPTLLPSRLITGPPLCNGPTDAKSVAMWLIIQRHTDSPSPSMCCAKHVHAGALLCGIGEK